MRYHPVKIKRYPPLNINRPILCSRPHTRPIAVYARALSPPSVLVCVCFCAASRLYARNFGGELKLKHSASGEGTNATLRLSRNGTRLEPLVWPKAPDSIEELYAHVHL